MSTESAGLAVISIELPRLTIHPLAIRERFKTEELRAMAAAISEYGQLSPVLVRQRGGMYELLTGMRHLLAAEAAGLKTVQATVCRATDAQALELVGLERVTERKLDPLERSRYVSQLLQPVEQGGAGLTVSQVAERFGKSAEWVRRTCQLNQLPDPWRSRLVAGELAEPLARVLLPYLSSAVVIRCIEWHQFRHPKRWRTREDWVQLTRMIAKKYKELIASNELAQSEIVPCLDREIKATAAPDWHAEERIQRQTDRLEELVDREDCTALSNLGYRQRLSIAAAKGMLMPFADSLDDLKVLSEVLTERIEELEWEAL